jgi:hypothetical protein
MTTKKKSASAPEAAPEAPKHVINDIKISIQADDKTVAVHIVNPAACAQAASDTADGSLLSDFVEFCEDILDGNADASKLEITADNAEEVLSSKQPASAEPTETGAGGEGEGSEGDEEIAS